MSYFKAFLKAVVFLLCLIGGSVVVTTIYFNYFTDHCTTYNGLPFTSPDGKFNAYGAFTTCEERPSKMKIWLTEIDGDGSSSLVFDAIYTTSIKMDLKWNSYNELTILYPTVVKPTTNFSFIDGIRLYYEPF